MNYRYFAALIYVTETENEAVMRMYSWTKKRFPHDDQVYYETTLTENGVTKRIIAARQDEMGMTAAATLSMKLIQHCRPKYLIMPGIAAGVHKDDASDDQMYGDVILADRVWNYSNGKYVSPSDAEIVFGEVGFISRPTIIHVDPAILPSLRKAITCEKNECYVHIGPLASGSAVVANKSILDKQITGRYAETQGLEMEAYGVVYAAKHATEPRPYAVIAKSICDFADSRKNDVYQKFAAYTSCEFVKVLISDIFE